MPVPPYEPQPELATQRVPGGRRAALVVVVVALVVVGTLIWKPWGSTVAVATQPPATRLPVAVVTTPVQASSPSPSLSSPTFSVDGLGNIEMQVESGPQVVCEYKTIGRGRNARHVLAQLDAPPPLVTLGSAALNVGLKRMDLYVNVEMNRLATIFSAEWQPLQSEGPSQSVQVYRSNPVFEPISVTLAFVPEADDEVYRISIRVDWLNAEGDKLDTQYFVLNQYGTANTSDDKYIPDGCPSVVAS